MENSKKLNPNRGNKNADIDVQSQKTKSVFYRLKQSDFGKSMGPFTGIIYFIVILFAAHFLWKFTVIGDDSDQIVSFLGIDLSIPFNAMAEHVAFMTSKMLNLLHFPVELLENNVIRHDNDLAVRIVWSCTGIKQAYIFICIILFYKGPFKKKMWYIPLGLLLVYLFNIFRITAITALIKENPNWFYLLHEHAFKYMFYALIFGLWVIWEEKICIKTDHNKPKIK